MHRTSEAEWLSFVWTRRLLERLPDVSWRPRRIADGGGVARAVLVAHAVPPVPPTRLLTGISCVPVLPLVAEQR